MPSILAGISMPELIVLINLLGLPGIIVIIWFVDQKKINKQHENHQKMVAEILKNYKADVDKVSTYYERNVELVERYEKHADDLSEIIHLNTQVMTRLVEGINNNMFCPVIRDNGPKRG